MRWRWKIDSGFLSGGPEWSREGTARKIGEAADRVRQRRQTLRVHFARFVHSRLWLGLPVVAVVSFVLFFLLATIEHPVPKALFPGGVAAVVMAFCWGLGIWASTGRPTGKPTGRPTRRPMTGSTG